MSYPIIWKCCVCDETISVLDTLSEEFFLSSYRLEGKNKKHARICVDCNKSQHNFTRKRGVRVR